MFPLKNLARKGLKVVKHSLNGDPIGALNWDFQLKGSVVYANFYTAIFLE